MSPRHREFDFGQPSVEPIIVKLGLGAGRPEDGKRDPLNKHAIMHMNRRLLDQFNAGWSEETIAARASMLFEDAILIWPR